MHAKAALAETQETQAGLLLAARFRLMGMVGEGGMGTVFRAYDTELEELIALKLLRRSVLDTPSALARFRQEVKLARRVAHPSVARIYDLGVHDGDRFLTMEFIDGESLGARLLREGPLPVACAVGIAQAIASALVAVHGAGVIHRDLKPDNVLIDSDGRVVVTDFGIARPVDDGERLARTQGGFIGTPGYMAPEQFNGADALDPRADLFSLGVLLFEMLAGQAPWTAPSALALLVARISHPPADLASLRPDAPAPLVALTHQLLAADPAQRPADATAVLQALGAPACGVVAERPVAAPRQIERGKTVAVLPLRAPPAIHHLAVGIAEALTDGLSMTAGLRVVAHARSEVAATQTADPTRLGSSLGAQVLVGGTLTALGDQYALQVRLTTAADGIQFWARRFQGPLASLLDLAEAATRAVAEALVVRAATPVTRPLMDATVLDLYLRGRAAYLDYWVPAVKRAVELIGQAAQRAPDNPLIAGGLALARARLVVLGEPAGGDEAEVARLADRALAQLPGQAQAHLAHATLALNSGDAERAGRGVAAALRAAPGDPEALEMAGRLRSEIGPLHEAMALFDMVARLDPALPALQVHRVRARALLGDWDAVATDLTLEARDPDRRAYFETTHVRLLGWQRDAEGARALQAARRRDGVAPVPAVDDALGTVITGALAPGATARLLALAGDPQRRPRLRAFFHQLHAEQLALVGDPAGALDAIEAADGLGFFDLAWLDGCPLFEGLRGDPRFLAVHRSVAARATIARAALDGL